MPIYEYQCNACGHRLEKLQKIKDEPIKVCPACEDESLVKLISAAAFRLKGSGWYETDFKQGNKKNLVDSEKTGGTGTSDSGPSDSSTDSSTKVGKDSAKADKASSGDGNGKKSASASAS